MVARGRRAFLRSAATVAVVVVALAGGIAVGQEDPAKRTLTIEVRVAAPGQNTTQPVANAIVRIEGADDSRDTNAQGRARFAGIASDKVSVQIMAVGADLCRLPDVTLAAGDQIVRVLVDTSSTKERCRRLE